MSEVQVPAAPSVPADAALSLGARLRSTRKARALTIEQVGERLHLEESMLRAIEEDRYEALGAPVFVRGYLKAYAGLLGLPEQSVLDAYRQADPASTEPPRLVRDREELPTAALRLPGGLTTVGVLVFLLALFLAFRSTNEGSAPPAAVPEPVTEPAVPAGLITPPAATLTAVTPSAETGKLVLEFQEASWVDISDGSGRLLSGEQPAGSRQVLGGQPPYTLALGNAPGVRLSVDGQPWPVPEGARSEGSNVARFRIESLAR